MFAQRVPTGIIAMSENERLIRARIARLTELLTELDEYSTPRLTAVSQLPLRQRRQDKLPINGEQP